MRPDAPPPPRPEPTPAPADRVLSATDLLRVTLLLSAWELGASVEAAAAAVEHVYPRYVAQVATPRSLWGALTEVRAHLQAGPPP